jgi:hypothetical protein
MRYRERERERELLRERGARQMARLAWRVALTNTCRVCEVKDDRGAGYCERA